MANTRRGQIILETKASWLELETAVRQLVVATLRNDAQAAEQIRRKAHDLLDLHFDLKVEGVAAIRLDIQRQIRRG